MTLMPENKERLFKARAYAEEEYLAPLHVNIAEAAFLAGWDAAIKAAVETTIDVSLKHQEPERLQEYDY